MTTCANKNLLSNYTTLFNLTLNGKQGFIDGVKMALYQYNNEVFNWLNFNDDEIYMDPLFFAAISKVKDREVGDSIDLYFNSLFFGYGNSGYQKKGVKVISDEYGLIYIPRMGWIDTRQREAIFTLQKQENKGLQLFSEGKLVSFELEEITKTGNNIEVLLHGHPLLKQFFYSHPQLKQHYQNREDRWKEARFNETFQKHKEHVDKAMSIFKSNIYPVFFLVKEITNKLVLFHISPKINDCFTNFRTYGGLMLNVHMKDCDEIFFIDDIAHQAGHLILDSISYDTEKFYRIDPIKPNKLFSDTFPRNASSFFHALFTYTLITTALDAYLDEKLFGDNHSKQEEAKRRLLYSLIIFQKEFSRITKKQVQDCLANNGLIVFDIIDTTYDFLSDKYQQDLKTIGLVDIPIQFNYRLFKEKYYNL